MFALLLREPLCLRLRALRCVPCGSPGGEHGCVGRERGGGGVRRAGSGGGGRGRIGGGRSGELVEENIREFLVDVDPFDKVVGTSVARLGVFGPET